MTNTRRIAFVMVVLALGALACNLNAAEPDPTAGDAPPTDAPPTDAGEPTSMPEPTATPAEATGAPEPQASGGDEPAAPTATGEPEEAAVTPEDVCLTAGPGETLVVDEAGGYCFLITDEYEVTQDAGLDTFVAGPVLAEFGMEGIALAFGFNVIGAPGGAGDYTPQTWGERMVDETNYELSVEPYVLRGAGLSGVLVGPMPGMVSGEAVYVRTNDTLYGITVYPEREGFPEYAEQVNDLWTHLNDTVRFFPPQDTGVEYRTAEEVCPAEEPGTQLVIRYTQGWCVLIPDDWHEDVENSFMGRFVGGPEIGEFWPGQPDYANITIGNSGPAGNLTLEEQAEGRINANGQPDLVQRTDAEIGGYPAVILDTQDGPVPDRLALIHTNSNIYSVLGQPFDEGTYPEAQPALEEAWDVMINSVQFFEPYS